MKIYCYEFEVRNRKMRMIKKTPYKSKRRKYIKEIRRRIGNITVRKSATKFKNLQKFYLECIEYDVHL